MSWINAPIGLTPRFRTAPVSRPARTAPASGPKADADPRAAVSPSTWPPKEPAPIFVPDPPPDAVAPPASRLAKTLRHVRWRVCAVGLCRRKRQCLWRSQACLEGSRAQDPEAMAYLLRGLRARLGTGPQPGALAPVKPSVEIAGGRRRRPGARRRAASAPLRIEADVGQNHVALDLPREATECPAGLRIGDLAG